MLNRNSSCQPRIVFRADGNNKIGLGHIFRSMALAEMLKENFDCIFWMRNSGQKVVDLVNKQYFCNIIPSAVSVAKEIEMLQSSFNGSEILVLDGYHFKDNYQRDLKDKVSNMVCIDDLVEGNFLADIIINHGNSNAAGQYKAPSFSKILAGAEYALLRRTFLKAARKKPRAVAVIDTLFICMGGADPFNVTTKVLRAALQTRFLKKIYVVVGQAYIFYHELDVICRSSDKHEIIVENGISAQQIVDRLMVSQLAVCPSSSIVLEVASVKCGLLTGMVADNQQAIHDMVVVSGAAATVHNFNSISVNDLSKKIESMNNPVQLQKMMEKQSMLIDGYSDVRLLNEFKLLHKC